MKVFIGYATREGQSRRIARHAGARLMAQGHSVELIPVAEAEAGDLADFDRTIIVASVHAGRYPRPLSDFAAAAAERLSAMPGLFLSVSLSAAGHDAEDWRSLDKILADLQTATGWMPGRVEQVAGAYRPSRYDLFTRLVMRRIIADKDPETDLGADREYTDYAALDRVIDAWLAE